MKNTFLFVAFILLGTLLSAQSPTIKKLKKEETVRTGYYLYPSTLRMLNFNDDPELNRLVKDVKKLSLWNMNSEKFDQTKMNETIEVLRSKEEMETYIEIYNDSLHVVLLGNDDNKTLVTLANQQGEFYIAELQGTINMGVLPKLINNLSQRDNNQNDGISMIFDAMTKDVNRQKRREQRRKQWEEDRKKDEMEKGKPTENTPVDSSKSDTLKVIEVKKPEQN